MIPDIIAVVAVWLAAVMSLHHAWDVSALWLFVSAVALWLGDPSRNPLVEQPTSERID
jgi:hypothetical protein